MRTRCSEKPSVLKNASAWPLVIAEAQTLAMPKPSIVCFVALPSMKQVAADRLSATTVTASACKVASRRFLLVPESIFFLIGDLVLSNGCEDSISFICLYSDFAFRFFGSPKWSPWQEATRQIRTSAFTARHLRGTVAILNYPNAD